MRGSWHHTGTKIPTPKDFDFWRTVYSHGWCDLQPFSFDPENRTLSRILSVDGSTTVGCTLKDGHGGISVTLRSRFPLSTTLRHTALLQLRACLRLDEDFQPFLTAARRHPRFRWIASTKSGRMLRAPSVFEDVVRMICTTNCSWALTRVMVSNLVKLVGPEFDNGQHAFPRPQEIAVLSERTLRAKVKAGYRAPYILRFARQIAEGKLDIESLRHSNLQSEAILEKLLEIKGVGPYAAQNLMKLLGRYDRLGLDSWSRGKFYQLHCNGRKVKDATIERHYEEYGEWRGLFFWLEMTREWHDERRDDAKQKPEKGVGP